MRKYKMILCEEQENNRILLKNSLEGTYEVEEVNTERELLEKLLLSKDKADMLVMNPKNQGIRFEKLMVLLNQKNIPQQIPVILISEQLSAQQEMRYYDMGIQDFIIQPFEMKVIKPMLANTFSVFEKKWAADKPVSSEEEELKDKVKSLEKLNAGMYALFGSVIEYRNTGGVSKIENFKALTYFFAKEFAAEYKEYKLTEEDAELIAEAACLHDVGKLLLPDAIVFKSGLFSESEREVMKSHTTKGAEMIRQIATYQDEKFQRYCYEICRYHHERYDGSGYPDGLKNIQIPVSAQIVSIVDCFHALTEGRIYRKAYSFEKAVQMILEGECGMFSPQLIACFTKNKDRMLEIEKAERV